MTDCVDNFLFHSYHMDHENSVKHLCRSSKILQSDQKTNILDLATSIESFISHDSVQDLVDQIWTGSINHDVSLPAVFLAFIFPPYLLTFRFLVKGQHTEFKTESSEDFVDG